MHKILLGMSRTRSSRRGSRSFSDECTLLYRDWYSSRRLRCLQERERATLEIKERSSVISVRSSVGIPFKLVGGHSVGTSIFSEFLYSSDPEAGP